MIALNYVRVPAAADATRHEFRLRATARHALRARLAARLIRWGLALAKLRFRLIVKVET